MGQVKYLPFTGQSTKVKEPELDRTLCATCGEEWHTHLTKKGDRVLAKYRSHTKTGTLLNRRARRAQVKVDRAGARREQRTAARFESLHWLQQRKLEQMVHAIAASEEDASDGDR